MTVAAIRFAILSKTTARVIANRAGMLQKYMTMLRKAHVRNRGTPQNGQASRTYNPHLHHW